MGTELSACDSQRQDFKTLAALKTNLATERERALNIERKNGVGLREQISESNARLEQVEIELREAVSSNSDLAAQVFQAACEAVTAEASSAEAFSVAAFAEAEMAEMHNHWKEERQEYY